MAVMMTFQEHMESRPRPKGVGGGGGKTAIFIVEKMGHMCESNLSFGRPLFVLCVLKTSRVYIGRTGSTVARFGFE